MYDMAGHANTPKTTIDRITAFLEKSGISYCKTNHKEIVYCGKDLNGESVYKPKHYLLWTLHEILNQFNPREFQPRLNLGFSWVLNPANLGEPSEQVTQVSWVLEPSLLSLAGFIIK